MAEHDTMTGEVLDPSMPDRPGTQIIQNGDDMSLAAGLTKAEIDQQISTAKRYPRQVSTVMKNIETLATLDMQTATECIYVLPRDGKRISGPSVRFAEIVVQAWGNCRVASRVTNIGEKHLEATGIYHDLETNMAIARSVQVRITNRQGKRYGDDMIGTASAAAVSKALRNAILAGVPKGVWRKGLDKAQNVIAGTAETLAARRHAMVVRMGEEFGAKPAEIFQVLGVADLADVTLGHMIQLAGVYTSVTTGEARWSDIVEASAPAPAAAPDAKRLSGANGPKADPKPEAKAEEKPKPKPAAKPAAKAEDKAADTGKAEKATEEPAQAQDSGDSAEDTQTATEAASEPETTPSEETTREGDDDAGDEGETPTAWATFIQGIGTADGWPDIRAALFAMLKTPEFDAMDAAAKAQTFKTAWQAAVGLNERTGAPLPDPAKAPDAFRVWVEYETSPDRIEEVWMTLASSATYGKMPQGGRDDLIAAKKARKAAIREEANA